MLRPSLKEQEQGDDFFFFSDNEIRKKRRKRLGKKTNDCRFVNLPTYLEGNLVRISILDGRVRATAACRPVHLAQKLHQKPHHPLARNDSVRRRQPGGVGSPQRGLEGGHAPLHEAACNNQRVWSTCVRVRRGTRDGDGANERGRVPYSGRWLKKKGIPDRKTRNHISGRSGNNQCDYICSPLIHSSGQTEVQRQHSLRAFVAVVYLSFFYSPIFEFFTVETVISLFRIVSFFLRSSNV